MFAGQWLLILAYLLYSGKSTSSENIPCNIRKASAGYLCVCNATYCDTVEQPVNLPRGLYYHYVTAKESPGISFSTESFINTNTTMTQTVDENDVLLQVDSSKQYQSFEGIGAALTASSAIAISRLPLAAKQKFIESYFGPTGIEFSFIRVPIEPSDFTPRYSTYDDVPGDVELKNFNLTEDDVSFKIPIIKMAMNVSKRNIKLLGVSWTAPTWMKTNNDVKAGYIKTKYLSVWANYILRFLQSYKGFGLDFWGITEGNQLMIYWILNLPIPSLLMTPQQARFFTKNHLGPLLETCGFANVKLFALDDERPFMMWYFNRMCSDKEAEKYVDGVALHWYFDDGVNVQLLDEFHEKFPDKLILYTESSIIDFIGFEPPELCSGDWMGAVIYINNIFQNLAHWVGGYFDWNLALDENGGPAGFQNGTMNTQTIINTKSGEFYKQPVHYVLGHFSKFISPGAKIIDVKVDDDMSRKPNDEYFIQVANNKVLSKRMKKSLHSPDPTKRPFLISTSVSALAALNPDGSHVVIAYNAHPNPVNLIVVDSVVGMLNQTVSANSLNTFLYCYNWA